MPQLETLGNLGDALQHLVVDRSLHIKARSSQADLPGVEKDRQRGADRGLVEVGVGKDQRRRLAAQFKGHALQIARGGLNDLLAHAVEPVKAILSMPGCSTSAWPASWP
jgi:hypothetical protein